MAETEVVNAATPESPKVESAAPAAPAPETTQEENDITTWKKRLAGKDQALTAAKAELDSIRKEAESLKKWKVETEQANMSEFDKAQNRLAALEQELNEAKEAAKLERLRNAYPNYSQFLTDTAGLSDDARAAAFEKYMAAIREDKAEGKADVFIERNNPQKGGAVSSKRGISDIVADLEKLGNPFSER
jgi:chromosome segregation ATPase